MATYTRKIGNRRATSPARLHVTLFLVATSVVAVFNAISSILLPRIVEQVDPASKVRDLGMITTIAAVLTAFDLIAGGTISDP